MREGLLYLHHVNKRDGTLYVGVTNELSRRVWEYRESMVERLTKRSGLKRLVGYEFYDDIRNAPQRRRISSISRARKLVLIHEMNPDWNDLYEQLNW